MYYYLEHNKSLKLKVVLFSKTSDVQNCQVLSSFKNYFFKLKVSMFSFIVLSKVSLSFEVVVVKAILRQREVSWASFLGQDSLRSIGEVN